MKEDKASWVNLFQWLRGRGLDGVKLIVGDKCLGMLEAVGEVFPEAKYQGCVAFLSKHLLCCAEIQGEAGCQDAQGDSRAGEQESCPRKGESGGDRIERHEAERGRLED